MQESRKGPQLASVEHAAGTDLTPARLTIALAWVAARRERDKVFGSALFLTPAWDILLDLYINHAQGRVECVSGVCVASSAPATTVSRWIGLLEKEGLLDRWADPRDKRRTLLALSLEGLQKMERALDASAQSDAKLGLGRLRFIQ